MSAVEDSLDLSETVRRVHDGELYNVLDFGRELLGAKDLDPVYVVLWKANMEPALLRRWLIAYWCFYHVGTASWAVDSPDWTGGSEGGFWDRMETAAEWKEYPRCRERRHFRGDKAIAAVRRLRNIGVGGVFSLLRGGETLQHEVSARDVIERAQRLPQFGPWISFKVADMMERLGLLRVHFTTAEAMYDGSPTEGAKLLWNVEGRPMTNGSPVTAWAASLVLQGLGEIKAPPRYERPLGLQEAETILCKWHSYVHGHYRIGEDVEAVRKSLLRFTKCRTAQRLFAAGKGELW